MSVSWENVYVFISSTFNDMHAERDYLVKTVFPELAEWCVERKLRLIDIDLRWGITTADSQSKNTVRTCLQNIDRCRPFFLCFLGQRRGWVPDTSDIAEDTYVLFPKLSSKRYAGKTSVTEMEIIHALIDPMYDGDPDNPGKSHINRQAREYAFFFFRDPSYLKNMPHSDLKAIYTNRAELNESTADKELRRWRKIIASTGKPIIKYTAQWIKNERTPEIALPLCVPTISPKDSEQWKNAFDKWMAMWAHVGVKVDDSGVITGYNLEAANVYNEKYTRERLGGFRVGEKTLSETIILQLQKAIAVRFPNHMSIELQDRLQAEIDQQAQFLHMSDESFVEREGDYDAIRKYIKGDGDRPFAVIAKAGYGKTCFLAHFINTFKPSPDESLHFRFIGGSDGSVDIKNILWSIFEELHRYGKIKTSISADDIIEKAPDYFAQVAEHGKSIIIIDALDQLDCSMSELSWLSNELPANIKLIVSFELSSTVADHFCKAIQSDESMPGYEIKPLSKTVYRQMLIDDYLSQYLKELDMALRDEIINSDGADNPLFLKIVLSELRVFGSFSDLGTVVRQRFGNTPESAFDAMLHRLEEDPSNSAISGKYAVQLIIGLLAYSRWGLTRKEIADSFKKEMPDYSDAVIHEIISGYLRQLRAFLIKRNSCIDIRYESFRQAAKRRYKSGQLLYNKILDDISYEIVMEVLQSRYFPEYDMRVALSRIIEINTLFRIGEHAGERDFTPNREILYSNLKREIDRRVEKEGVELLPKKTLQERRIITRPSHWESKPVIETGYKPKESDWQELEYIIKDILSTSEQEQELANVRYLMNARVPTADDFPSGGIYHDWETIVRNEEESLKLKLGELILLESFLFVIGHSATVRKLSHGIERPKYTERISNNEE